MLVRPEPRPGPDEPAVSQSGPSGGMNLSACPGGGWRMPAGPDSGRDRRPAFAVAGICPVGAGKGVETAWPGPPGQVRRLLPGIGPAFLRADVPVLSWPREETGPARPQ